MIYRFGPFELDERTGELRRGGEPVPVQPKPFALLALLLRERDRVVSQEELFEALWPGTAVTSGSLTRAVSHARRAIGDAHRGERLRSVPRRGYRFVGEVVVVGDESPRDTRAPRSTAAPTADAGDPFVGREEARARLRESWECARAGAGRLVLVSGAAGIGKTRLCEVFARDLDAEGARVLVARARDGEGVPAFWLWSQVLRALSEAGLAGEAGNWEALLEQAGQGADSERRFRFFDAVTRELVEAGRRRPLAVVLEDLQWARPTSLRLLEHLAFELGTARILLIATVRDEPRERGHPLGRTLSALRQHDHVERIELKGLSRRDIGRLLTHAIGRPPPADLTSEVFARTEGVPLFAREAIRLLRDRGELRQPERIGKRGIALPDHAMDLIRRSLDALPEACAGVVEAGAVLGREFALPTVAAVAERSRDEVLDLLDAAVAAGVLQEVPEAPATYRFTHALFQEAAYDGLPPGRRARLHERAAGRLEAQHAGDPSPVIAELAHHHHRSLAVGDPELAHRRAVAAAEQARAQLAYEQAATHYQQAVDALEHLESVDPARRLAALIELGEAHRQAGDRARRREVSARALESARALGWHREFAEAAIRFCDVSEWSPEDEAAAAVVDEALAGVDPAEVGLRARLVARQAYLAIREPRSRALAREAVALARKSGDPETLQEAMYVLHYSLAGPDHLAEREALIEELIETALRSRARETSVIAALDVACDRLTLGDAAGARRMRERVAELCGASPSPAMRWHTRVYDTGCLLLEGRVETVEQATTDALALGRRLDHPYAQACFNGQRMQLLRYRRDYEAIRPLFARAVASRFGANRWACAVLARNELALGEEGRARELWEELARADFADVARGIRWIGTLVETAHLCADLGDAARARALIELLGPAEHQHGVLPVPVLYGGPASYALARLHEGLGVADVATGHYEQALAAAAAMGARPMEARIAADLARLLARRGEHARAAELEVRSEALVAETGCRL